MLSELILNLVTKYLIIFLNCLSYLSLFRYLHNSYLSQTIAVSNDFKYSYFYDFRKIIYETKEGFLFKKDKVMSDVSFDLSTRLQSIYANTKESLVPLSLSTFQFSINQEYPDK